MVHEYADALLSPSGPSDVRPTALRIVENEKPQGQLKFQSEIHHGLVLWPGCSNRPRTLRNWSYSIPYGSWYRKSKNRTQQDHSQPSGTFTAPWLKILRIRPRLRKWVSSRVFNAQHPHWERRCHDLPGKPNYGWLRNSASHQSSRPFPASPAIEAGAACIFYAEIQFPCYHSLIRRTPIQWCQLPQHQLGRRVRSLESIRPEQDCRPVDCKRYQRTVWALWPSCV